MQIYWLICYFLIHSVIKCFIKAPFAWLWLIWEAVLWLELTYLNFLYLRLLLILWLYRNSILTYTLTPHSLTHSLTHPPTDSLTHSLIHSLIDINTETRRDTKNKTTQKTDLKLQNFLILIRYGLFWNGEINCMYITCT